MFNFHEPLNIGDFSSVEKCVLYMIEIFIRSNMLSQSPYKIHKSELIMRLAQTLLISEGEIIATINTLVQNKQIYIFRQDSSEYIYMKGLEYNKYSENE